MRQESELIIKDSPEAEALDAERLEKFVQCGQPFTVSRNHLLSGRERKHDRVWEERSRETTERVVDNGTAGIVGESEFMKFMASGYLRTTQSRIWSHFLMACAFQVESIVTGMMKYSLRFEKEDVKKLCVGKFFDFLLPIESDRVRFFEWLVKNNPERFKADEIAGEFSESVLITLLEIKAALGDLLLPELRALERVLNTRYGPQANPKFLRNILPTSLLSVEAVEYFRNKLFTDEKDYMGVLMKVRDSLIEKQKTLERKRKSLKKRLEEKQAESVRVTKEYFVRDLQAVLDEDRRVHPQRYEVAAHHAQLVSEHGVNGYQEPPSSQLRQSPPKKDSGAKGRDKKNSRKQPDDDEYEKAIQQSKEQERLRASFPPSGEPHNPEAPFCNIKERIALNCRCVVCVACLANLYYAKTDEMNFDEPLDYSKAEKKRLSCWSCRATITKNDVSKLNSIRASAR